MKAKAYEGMFILLPDLSADALQSQIKGVEDIVRKFGGTIVQKVELGKKPLGYLLKKSKEGFFLFLEFQMDTDQAIDFRKMLGLQENLLNFMITIKNLKVAKKQAEKAKAAAARPAIVPHPVAVPHSSVAPAHRPVSPAR